MQRYARVEACRERLVQGPTGCCENRLAGSSSMAIRTARRKRLGQVGAQIHERLPACAKRGFNLGQLHR